MGASGLIWVTRAQPGAEATAGRLRALGHAPLVASLLVVHPLTPPHEAPDGVAALAFTSANAVQAYARWTSDRRAPVYAVGPATALAACSAGFAKVKSADGDVAALAARIAAEPPSGLLLHPCARETAGDLGGALAAAGVPVKALPLYETRPVARLPAEVADALQRRRVRAMLFHSPKAAAALASLWAKDENRNLAQVQAYGLSAACLAPVAHLPFVSTLAPARPNEAALLELLE